MRPSPQITRWRHLAAAASFLTGAQITWTTLPGRNDEHDGKVDVRHQDEQAADQSAVQLPEKAGQSALASVFPTPSFALHSDGSQSLISGRVRCPAVLPPEPSRRLA